MVPLSLLAASKVSGLLTNGNAIQQQIANIASTAHIQLPVIGSSQVYLSSAPPDLADKNIQLAYPRICVYCSSLQNKNTEKFRSFSGVAGVTAEVWASANLLTQVDQWIHFYVEGLTEILRSNPGDWGDGFSFYGQYDVQFQPPKPGGVGFVESAKVTCLLDVSLA